MPDIPVYADTANLMKQADGFVVVSLWSPKPGEAGGDIYEYERMPSLNEACDLYRDYREGEYSRARAIGIIPVRNGMPCGDIDATELLRLMAEYPAA